HRTEVLRYGAIAAGVVVLVLAFMYYARHQHAVRQEALAQALQVQEAPVGNSNPNAPVSFPTEEAKQREAIKKFSEVASKYSGSDEAQIAQFYLASINADQGKMADAGKLFKQVADSGDKGYASMAKLSLAQMYFADGHAGDAEKLLRGLIDNPTVFVSKE